MFATNSVSHAGTIVIIVGVALCCPTGANAQASGPAVAQAPAAAAQQQADAARERAAELARAGGWAYKTGRVEQAQRDAARYQAEADEAFAEAHPCAPPAAPAPALAAALARLKELHRAGGWAYKTGAVARAEREVQSLATSRPMSICEGRQAQPRDQMTSMR